MANKAIWAEKRLRPLEALSRAFYGSGPTWGLFKVGCHLHDCIFDWPLNLVDPTSREGT